MVELILEDRLFFEEIHTFGVCGNLDGNELSGNLDMLCFPDFPEPTLSESLEKEVLRNTIPFIDLAIRHNSPNVGLPQARPFL
jgi:hypothetical protein